MYNRLLEYESWETKKLIPALCESYTMSDDGKRWVLKLRQGVKWHSGEEFTAQDVKWNWDCILDKRYASINQSNLQKIFGSPNAYTVTGKYEITVDLPKYSNLFKEIVMGAIGIMPEHAFKDVKPEALNSHTANTWLGSYTVKTSDGKEYTARGGIGTGPFIAMGLDPAKKAYKLVKNPTTGRRRRATCRPSTSSTSRASTRSSAP